MGFSLQCMRYLSLFDVFFFVHIFMAGQIVLVTLCNVVQLLAFIDGWIIIQIAVLAALLTFNLANHPPLKLIHPTL